VGRRIEGTEEKVIFHLSGGPKISPERITKLRKKVRRNIRGKGGKRRERTSGADQKEEKIKEIKRREVLVDRLDALGEERRGR